MLRQYTVTVFSTSKTVFPRMYFVQHDTESSRILLKFFDKPNVPITGITYATATVRRSDTNTYTYGSESLEISGNEVTFILPPSALYTIGEQTASVSIYGTSDGEEIRLTTYQFKYTVTEDLTATTPIDETNEYPILTEFISAENTRVDNENLRIVNESTRQSNEVIRQQRMQELEEVSSVQFDSRLSSAETQLNDIATNVKAFGAKGDGVTDDTSAIQNAINSGAKTIYIPDGNYMINGQSVNDAASDRPDSGLVLGSNIHLIMSKNAYLKLITNDHKNSCILRTADNSSNITIEGGNLIGDRLTHTGTLGEAGMGIFICAGNNIIIKDVYISNCWGDGIIINSDGATHSIASKNVHISNVVCDNNRRQGMSVVAVDGLTVTNSRFINTNGTSPQCGVDIEPSAYTAKTCTNIKFVNCTFTGNANFGLIATAAVGNVSNLIINDSHFSNNANGGVFLTSGVKDSSITSCNVSNTTNGYGICASGCTGININSNNSKNNSQYGVYVYGGSNNTIVGNVCNNNTLSGVYAFTTSLVTITGNACNNNAAHGIEVKSSNRITCSSNICSQNTKDGIGYSTVINSSISSNMCELNLNYGIEVASTSTDILVNSNYCIGNGGVANNTYGNIIVNNSSYCSVIGNTCRVGSQTNKPLAGIIINWYSTTTNVMVANNDCYQGGSTNGIRDTGTGTKIGYNVMFDGSYSQTAA